MGNGFMAEDNPHHVRHVCIADSTKFKGTSWRSLQRHNIHAKFNENPSSHSRVTCVWATTSTVVVEEDHRSGVPELLHLAPPQDFALI
jgi:hypothetical protein